MFTGVFRALLVVCQKAASGLALCVGR